jgi:hypothetical protein
MQSGDAETAVCHVCEAQFETQADLLRHLQAEHPDDLLPDPKEEG